MRLINKHESYQKAGFADKQDEIGKSAFRLEDDQLDMELKKSKNITNLIRTPCHFVREYSSKSYCLTNNSYYNNLSIGWRA
jgi:hypothetical protein